LRIRTQGGLAVIGEILCAIGICGFGDTPRLQTQRHIMIRLLAILALFAPVLDAGIISPSLLEVADIAATDGDWQQRARQLGVTADAEGRIHFAADANGRYTIWDADRLLSLPYTFRPGLLDELRAALPDVELLPESSDSYLHLAAYPWHVRQVAARLASENPNLTIVQINPPQTTYGAVVSEGVTRTRVHDFHALGLRGRGSRVAVLDLGFGGVTGRMGGEVGPFYEVQGKSELNSDVEIHGTACAEIVRDVAPEAELLLLRLQGLGTANAVQRAIDFQCDVISVSVAWMGYPANGPECDAARTAIDNGIHWVNAAGNWNQNRYWEALTPMVDADDNVEFAPGEILNRVTPANGYLQFGFSHEAPDEHWARYQVTLYERLHGDFLPVATGNANSYFQYIHYRAKAGRTYALGIREIQPGIAGRMRIQTFYSTLQYNVREGSVTNPATVPGVLCIGAVNQGSYSSGGPATDYSSRGGGAFDIVLDMCGPTACSTLTYSGTFHGTSCATPHVAGLIAVLKAFAPTADDPLAYLQLRDTWTPELGHGVARIDTGVLKDRVILAWPTGAQLPDGAALVPYHGPDFGAANGLAPYRFAVTQGALPEGMLLDATGRLQGVPVADGEYAFEVTVTDAAERTATRIFQVNIQPQGSLLIVAPYGGFLPHGHRQRGYDPVKFQFAGGQGPVSFSVSDGALPPGLSLSDTGAISGTPTRVGTWGFTVRAADSEGASVDCDYFIAVNGPSPIRQLPGVGCAAGTAPARSWAALLVLALLVTRRLPAALQGAGSRWWQSCRGGG
jgi:hypothetical protein